MEKERSLTITALAVGAVIMVGQHVGVELTSGELQTWLLTTGKLVAIIGALGAQAVAWYGRVRKGDISITGVRKDNA